MKIDIKKYIQKINLKACGKNLCMAIVPFIVIYFVFSVALVIYTFRHDLRISPALQAQFKGLAKKEPGKYNIAIIAPERMGEQNQAEMVYKVAEKMGYPAYIYKANDVNMEVFIPSRILNNMLIYVVNKLLDIDFTLAMSFHVNLDIVGPRMMYISIPPLYFVRGVKEKHFGVNYYKYFLDINLINRSDDWMSDALGRKIVTSYGMVGCPASEYKTSDHKKLIMYGSLWGRRSKAIDRAMNRLAEEDYMYFIHNHMLALDEQKDIKFVKENGTPEDLLRVLNEHGIALCIHASEYHLAAGIPSSRIFEIITSGAVAISDLNPFVIKYFGDSVLYFDQSLSEDEIFKQIDSHVKWVQKHPKEAKKMTKKAHKILQENFTTERFIQDMIKFYETKIHNN